MITSDQRRLAELMSGVSEECYYAGWMLDTEFEVWSLVTGGGRWGHGDAAEIPALASIRSLAEHLGCWILWNDSWTGPGDDDWRAVPLDEWREQYANRLASGWLPESQST